MPPFQAPTAKGGVVSLFIVRWTNFIQKPGTVSHQSALVGGFVCIAVDAGAVEPPEGIKKFESINRGLRTRCNILPPGELTRERQIRPALRARPGAPPVPRPSVQIEPGCAVAGLESVWDSIFWHRDC